MSSVDFVFLDSGTGGIPYLSFLKQQMPSANCIYVADNANFPYGEKSHEEIVKAVLTVTQKIVDRFNPKVIVMACNTMSVNSLDVVREAFPEVNFVGTVPAIKLAASVSSKRRIGLLATNATVSHPYNQDLKNHFAGDCAMICRGDPKLISFIEHQSFTATKEEILEAVRPAVDFFRKENCDVIILGCTHFLNLKQSFMELGQPDIKIVDSVEGVTKRALSLLKTNGAVKSCNEENKSLLISKLYITGFTDKKDEKEYNIICERYKLSFGGLI